MRKIKLPVLGCTAYATKQHTSYRAGANLGDCIELKKGLALFSNGSRLFTVHRNSKIEPAIEFYINSSKNELRAIELRYYIKEVARTIQDFSNKTGIPMGTIKCWLQLKWIVYDNKLYSPQNKHDELFNRVWISDEPITLSDLISFSYDNNARRFHQINDIALENVQKWSRNGWLVYNGTIYSPQRDL